MGERQPIVQYWHSPDRPDPISELTRTFGELNPERPHLVFDAQAAARFIAASVGEREAEAFRACGPPAMQADYFRCCAIYCLGGVWADAGFACVRNLDPLLEAPDASGGQLFRSFVSQDILMNGLFAFPSTRHPFLRLAIEVSTRLIAMRWQGKVNEVTGPLVFSAIYGRDRAGSADAFLAELRERAPKPSVEHFVRYGEVVCELIGDRASEACAGLCVSPAEDRRKWVHSPEQGLPHRAPDIHWSKQEPNVYDTAGAQSTAASGR